MKKTVKAALFAVLVSFSSALFAATPISFVNETTKGLFTDETVDNFAWGIEDADGILLGGFNSGANPLFNFGYGKNTGSFWFSIYDSGEIGSQIQITETVSNDAVAKDGVNTDYVDVDYSKTKTDTFTVNNNLYLSFAGDDIGVQSYWLTNRISPALNNTADNINETSEDKETGYAYNHVKKTSNAGKDWTNTFGANFKGIGAFGDITFELTNFEVKWVNNNQNSKETKSTKTNGSIYGYTANDNFTTVKRIATNTITPAVTGKMSVILSDSEVLSTTFELEEKFDCTIKPQKNKSETTSVVEDATKKTTTTVTSYNTYHNGFTWSDTLTPKFIFEFEPDEKISVKASAGAGIYFYNTPTNGNWLKTTETKNVTEWKYDQTKTSDYQKTVQLKGSNTATVDALSNTFITTISPYTSLGFVYQVKPEKFNLNMGVKWGVSSFTWRTVTNKNTTVKTSDYKTETNELGDTKVTINTVDYKKRDGTAKNDVSAETRTTTFVGGSHNFNGTGYGNDEYLSFSLGATWFMTEKVQMDIAYANAFGGNFSLMGAGGLTQSALKLMFSVKF